MTDPRARRVWITTIVTSLGAFVSVGALALRDAGAPLPVLARVPSFSLVDQRGVAVTNDDLRGEPWIADFFFTACPTECPKQATRMAALEDEIVARHLRVRLVSISVDSENDTPPRLLEYAARWRADASRWSFLTGAGPSLERAFVDGYEISCVKAQDRGKADIGQVMHGSWFVLVDGEGAIRGYYDARSKRDVGWLLADAERLTRGADSKL